MARPVLVFHCHFYQPPRENPWTEEVAREPTAAPFHDWNARVTAECYRPNGWARVLDDSGRVVSIVDNYELLSFNVGPTLMSWLEDHAPETYARILAADEVSLGAIAQAHSHAILPLATERDVRTDLRWGLADFEHRFGRPAEGMWLPETAVNDTVLAVLAEEGVRFTILAPSQAVAVRPLAGEDGADADADADADNGWRDVSDGSIDIRRPYRWLHPSDDGRGVDIIFYDGPLSHTAAFELAGLSSQALVDRVFAAAEGDDDHGGDDGGGNEPEPETDVMVAIGADGETFGHHHHYGDRLLAYALAIEAPDRGLEVSSAARLLRRLRPTHEVRVRESAWSCGHGVGRWREDCGCSTGGERGWNQRWRAPLREALDQLRDHGVEVFERRAPGVLADPWAARDAYVEVLIGALTREEFALKHVTGDPVEAFTLLEAQRHALAMYASCGWFFNDLAGLETVQVLRYAARVMDLLVELGEPDGRERFLDVLARADSNRTDEGDGRAVWARHVDPARVPPERVVAHLALVELLEDRDPAPCVGVYDVEVVDHAHAQRGSLATCSGHVTLTHRRTGRRSEHVYAAVHLGGLEVLGASRASDADADAARDADALDAIRTAFANGERVTTLLRLVSERFGPWEFGLRSALPDGAEHILRSAATALADRFAGAYERLFADHRDLLATLTAAGYPLSPVLRAPAELALARQLEAEVAAQGGSLDPEDYATAIRIAKEAKASGLAIDTPQARTGLERLLLGAVELAVADPNQHAAAIAAALTALRVAGELGLHPSLERAQELVHDALGATPTHTAELGELGRALGLAVDAPPAG